MEKKKYYVTVGSGEVLENKEDSNYEFEILASEEDIDRLQDLFEEADNASQDSFFRSHVPFREYHFDEPNDNYDYYLVQVYKMLHELGNDQTKKHIEQMNILH